MFAKFEAGSFRKVPTSDDLVDSVRLASLVDFDAVEFAVLTRKQLDSTFNQGGMEKVTSAALSFDIKVPHVSFPFVSGIFPSSSNLPELRQIFSICAKITSDFGAEVLQLHSPPIPGTEATWDVAYPGGPARRISFHGRGDWKKIWETYVRCVGEMSDECKSYKLKLAIEARPREIINNTEAILNLLEDVSATNLGATFDTGHHFTMREILPISIWKLGSAIYSVQLSDNDGIIEYQWAPGEGNIDWRPTIEALKSIKYDGYLVIEGLGLGPQSIDFVKAREMIRALLQGKATPEVSSNIQLPK